jgi:cyanate permease
MYTPAQVGEAQRRNRPGPSARSTASAAVAVSRASAATGGLAMGAGYPVAGLGPLVMGLLIDATGGYPPAICVLLVGAAAQCWAISRVDDRCRTGDRS